MEELMPRFQLDFQKTKAAQLAEVQMEIQNDILKEQLKMLQKKHSKRFK